jgi:hypothetical protein
MVTYLHLTILGAVGDHISLVELAAFLSTLCVHPLENILLGVLALRYLSAKCAMKFPGVTTQSTGYDPVPGGGDPDGGVALTPLRLTLAPVREFVYCTCAEMPGH